ncbi:MAG: glycosyltransferase family 2 protein [Candidatus Eremiobacteraeota bacterium]|nr:glycosyltransferase family 2 protein [Candidatus Eremiobacteraeota bacterium]
MSGLRASVIIATKDRADYLQEALRSLSQQLAAAAFEVIVVDNGSTDWTSDVVKKAQATYPFTITSIFEATPNRGAARNRGIAAATGELIVFIDDDVWVPAGFLAAHSAAHEGHGTFAVSGPIINVPSYDERPKPSIANYSRAFLCTCNVSISREALRWVKGFDEQFDLYGWEDTELGVRLRENGVRAKFAWDAYVYHIKPPREQTLEVTLQKTLEKAQMAARFVKKNPSKRARMATGAYGFNILRSKALAPKWLLPLFAGVAADTRFPATLRSIARAQLLDGIYVAELERGLEQ